MMNKKLGMLLTGFIFLVTSSVAEAGWNLGDLVNDIQKYKKQKPSRILNDVLRQTTRKTKQVSIKPGNKTMVLDGSYYTGTGNVSMHGNRNPVIALYSVRLEEAASVSWHFITNGSASFEYSFKDSSNAEIFKSFVRSNSTRDVAVILDPGDYELSVNFLGSNNRPDGTYRVKGTKISVPTNVSSDLSSFDDAGNLAFGVEAINYFPANKNSSQLFHYYTFNVPYAQNVSVVVKPYSQNINTTFEILSEDQTHISKFYLYRENSLTHNLYLNPGKYYVRASCGQRAGEVYGLRVN